MRQFEYRFNMHSFAGYCGKSGKAARVALVATHADTASCHRVAATGEYVSSEASSVLKTARQKFGHLFELHDSVFILDTHVVGSPAMKTLKNYVAYNKDKVTQASVMLFHQFCMFMYQCNSFSF